MFASVASSDWTACYQLPADFDTFLSVHLVLLDYQKSEDITIDTLRAVEQNEPRSSLCKIHSALSKNGMFLNLAQFATGFFDDDEATGRTRTFSLLFSFARSL